MQSGFSVARRVATTKRVDHQPAKWRQSSELIRRGGPAAMLGGLLFIPYIAGAVTLHAAGISGEGRSHALYHALELPPNALMVVGVLGLYLRQREHFGKLGKGAAYLLTMLFAAQVVLGAGIIVSEGLLGGSVASLLDIVHPVMLLTFPASLLFGIATLRARMLPRAGALLLTVVPAVFLALGVAGLKGPWVISPTMILFGLAWALLGHGLVSGLSPASTRDRAAVA